MEVELSSSVVTSVVDVSTFVYTSSIRVLPPLISSVKVLMELSVVEMVLLTFVPMVVSVIHVVVTVVSWSAKILCCLSHSILSVSIRRTSMSYSLCLRSFSLRMMMFC